MLDLLREAVGWVIPAALFGFLLTLIPWRHRSKISARRTYAALSSQVWLHLRRPSPSTVSDTRDPADPTLRIVITDTSGGRGTSFSERKLRVLVNEPNTRSVELLEAIGGKPFPFGKGGTHTEEVKPVPGGTEATLIFEGDVANLFQDLHLRRHLRSELRRVDYALKTGSDPTPTWRTFYLPFILTILSVASFVSVMGLTAGLLLAFALFIHELGHYFAFRLAGHARPRLMLIPFLGGVVVSNQPYKSAYESALVSLAGAGLSAVIVTTLIVVAQVTGLPTHDGGQVALKTGTPEFWGFMAMMYAAALAALNLIQLLPFLPLDGGHIFASLIHSRQVDRTKVILVCISVLASLWSLAEGDYTIAILFGIGMMIALSWGANAPAYQPMSWRERGIVLAMLVVTVGIHGYAAAFVWGAGGMLSGLTHSALKNQASSGNDDTGEDAMDKTLMAVPHWHWQHAALILRTPLSLDVRWRLAKSDRLVRPG